MKILFCPSHYVYDEYYGGSEPSAAFNICDRVAQKYKKSVVITGSQKILNEKHYRIIEVQRKKNLLDMSAISAFLFNIKYTYKAFLLLRTEKFDVIHHVRPFRLYSTFNLIPILRLNKNTPFIIGSFASSNKTHVPSSYVKKNTVKDFFSRTLSFFCLNLLKKLSIYTIKRAEHVFVYDEELKNEISKYISKNKITIAPPGKDKDIYYPNNKEKSYDKIHIITVGALTPIKGMDDLIRGFALVKKLLNNVHLDIVGHGVDYKKLINLCEQLGITNDVTFFGHVENNKIPDLYRKAHLFAYMATEDSFGQVYIEAMASGLPIITAKNDGARRILNNLDFAILIKKGDYHSLAESIIEKVSRVDDIAKMGILARNHFEENYDWDSVIIPKYISVYEKFYKKI